VQVVASGFLMSRGIMLKDGGALERLATVDTVVFDKTGTLTEGEPRLLEAPAIGETEWAVAAALGGASRHPLARALARAARERAVRHVSLVSVSEQPGSGMVGVLNGQVVRLGRRDWVGGVPSERADRFGSEIWLRIGERTPVAFTFTDALRPDATQTIAALRKAGLRVILLSGDREWAVSAAARRVGLDEWRAEQRPADKAAFLTELAVEGRNVLMVGDGINDAPALATAAVSMSPSSAADISQTTASIVFTGRMLAPVVTAVTVARAARRLILQNFALAIGYNVIAVPLAVLGFATPLIAAVAMSTSSIIVTGNSLRLRLMVRETKQPRPQRGTHPVGADA
jgi:Cu2+-exporting ATPase